MGTMKKTKAISFLANATNYLDDREQEAIMLMEEGVKANSLHFF